MHRCMRSVTCKSRHSSVIHSALQTLHRWYGLQYTRERTTVMLSFAKVDVILFPNNRKPMHNDLALAGGLMFSFEDTAATPHRVTLSVICSFSLWATCCFVPFCGRTCVMIFLKHPPNGVFSFRLFSRGLLVLSNYLPATLENARKYVSPDITLSRGRCQLILR